MYNILCTIYKNFVVNHMLIVINVNYPFCDTGEKKYIFYRNLTLRETLKNLALMFDKKANFMTPQVTIYIIEQVTSSWASLKFICKIITLILIICNIISRSKILWFLYLNLPEFLRTEKRGKQKRVWCLYECCCYLCTPSETEFF